MCGRIAQTHTAEELQMLVGITVGSDQLSGARVSYNVSPTAILPTLVFTEGMLQWRALRWGMQHAWMRPGRPGHQRA